MIGYSATEVFSPKEVEAFTRATRQVWFFPEKVNGELVRCHEVARAVAQLLTNGWCVDTGSSFLVEDGVYHSYDHSWIVIYVNDSRSKYGRILDPYSVGVLPPVRMVGNDRDICHYTARTSRKDIKEDVVKELVHVYSRWAGLY